MKELSIEEKAKAYDHALEVIEKYKGANIMFTQDLKEEMFPSLKESEDEKIRKEIINYLKPQGDCCGNKERWIAWLEKQGEQKTVDKVESKFKVGDWVIDKQGIVHQIANVVENVTSHTYGYDVVGGGYFNDNADGVRLWTIQDAKDGDVLATFAGAFIYNGNNGGGSCPGSYCGIDTFGGFKTGVEHHWTAKKVYPATKEQRDTLERAITNAGYLWDKEKLKLEKI